MAGYKSDKVRLRSRAVKTLLLRLTGNQSEEAHQIGITVKTLHQKLDSLNDKYNLTLAEASLHSRGREIAQWFCRQVGLTATDPEVDPQDLNGQADDELWEIVAEAAAAHDLLEHPNELTIHKAMARLMKIKGLASRAELEIDNPK